MSDSVQIVDITCDLGWHLAVSQQPDGKCSATLTNPNGIIVYQNYFWPNAQESIESAVGHLVHGLKPALPHVATALKTMAFAELQS